MPRKRKRRQIEQFSRQRTNSESSFASESSSSSHGPLKKKCEEKTVSDKSVIDTTEKTVQVSIKTYDLRSCRKKICTNNINVKDLKSNISKKDFALLQSTLQKNYNLKEVRVVISEEEKNLAEQASEIKKTITFQSPHEHKLTQKFINVNRGSHKNKNKVNVVTNDEKKTSCPIKNHNKCEVTGNTEIKLKRISMVSSNEFFPSEGNMSKKQTKPEMTTCTSTSNVLNCSSIITAANKRLRIKDAKNHISKKCNDLEKNKVHCNPQFANFDINKQSSSKVDNIIRTVTHTTHGKSSEEMNRNCKKKICTITECIESVVQQCYKDNATKKRCLLSEENVGTAVSQNETEPIAKKKFKHTRKTSLIETKKKTVGAHTPKVYKKKPENDVTHESERVITTEDCQLGVEKDDGAIKQQQLEKSKVNDLNDENKAENSNKSKELKQMKTLNSKLWRKKVDEGTLQIDWEMRYEDYQILRTVYEDLQDVSHDDTDEENENTGGQIVTATDTDEAFNVPETLHEVYLQTINNAKGFNMDLYRKNKQAFQLRQEKKGKEIKIASDLYVSETEDEQLMVALQNSRMVASSESPAINDTNKKKRDLEYHVCREDADLLQALRNSLLDVSRVAASNFAVEKNARYLNEVNIGAGPSGHNTQDKKQCVKTIMTPQLHMEPITESQLNVNENEDVFDYYSILNIDTHSDIINSVVEKYATMADNEEISIPVISDEEYLELIELERQNTIFNIDQSIKDVITRYVELPQNEEVVVPQITDQEYNELSQDINNRAIMMSVEETIESVINEFIHIPENEEVVLPIVTEEEYLELVEIAQNVNNINSVEETIENVVRFYNDFPANEGIEIPRVDRVQNERNRILRLNFRGNALAAEIPAEQVFLDVHPVYLGSMTQTCVSCDALLFETDVQTAEGHRSCCQRGKVRYPEPQECPQFLRDLYTTQTSVAKNFRKNINSYNSAFCMISFPGSRAIVDMGPGQHIFKIQGHTYHRLYPADAPDLQQTKANQVYFLDPLEALNWRKNFTYVNDALVHELNDMLQEVNCHVRLFNTMREIMREEERRAKNENRSLVGFRLAIVHDKERARTIHRGRLNDPTNVYETAVVFEGEEPPENMILEIRPRDGGIQTINSDHMLVIPYTFPLLYPRGEAGHDRNMLHEGPNATAVRNRVTYRECYAYRIHIRPYFSPMFHAGRLFQKFLVNLYLTIEADRLNFIRRNQNTLFIETLNGLVDYVHNRAAREGREPGRVMVLPASFHGSPRHMHKLYLDAMAVVRTYSKPDYFITVTANPKWPEIVENLLPGQVAEDRPELVARVFEKKLKILKDLIMIFNIFGEVDAFIYTIEFQKRGLPHAHILLIMKPGYKVETPEDINRFISAVLPCEITDKELFDLVVAFMLHSPCGERYPAAKCMSKGKCSKFYPQPFREDTVLSDEHGRPGYRRPDNGRICVVRDHTYNNTRVVPHNPYITKKLKCHVCVEVCSTYRGVKYIFKYIFKGYDCLTIQARLTGDVLHLNEILNYINCRYVSACEAVWGILEYKSHFNTHAVILLHVHLPNEQNLSFRLEHIEAAIEAAVRRQSTLMAMFALNVGEHSELSRTLLYSELPNHFTWSVPERRWNLRGNRTRGTIGRLVEVPVTRNELYYLRVLLLHVRGPTSFEHLRTVNGVLFGTFKEACVELQLLRDDLCHIQCMQEAATSRLPSALRRLFAHLIVHCDVNNATALFEQFVADMTADFHRRGMTEVEARAACLVHVSKIVKRISGRILANEEVYEVLFAVNQEEVENAEVQVYNNQEVDYDLPDQINSLNHAQRQAYDAVMQAVAQQEGTVIRDHPHLFFVSGAGGTGKTYLYKCLITILKNQNLPYICLAWTGIAALLLDGGTTVHYSLALPLNLNSESSSSIKRNDRKAELLRNAALILWDEAPMAHKQALKILNNLLQFIMGNELPFGGKLVVLGGDFRQVLPVMPNVSQAQVAMASICNSEFWPMFTRFYLYINQRAGLNEIEFSNYLERLGDGNHARVPGRHESCIAIPHQLLTNKEQLVTSTFGDNPTETCNTRAILCPTNAAAFKMNELVLNRLDGELIHIYSADEASEGGEDDVYFPVEVMNTLTPTGLPPHDLQLKIGVPVMCLRNIDLEAGLCNGTRMRVLEINRNVLKCSILNGIHEGESVFIPKIEMEAPESSTPFPFKRYQFPVRVCFSMTINKAQGQTFDKIGLYLQRPVFSHGQLYVAFSRVRSFEHLKVCIEDDNTQGHYGNQVCTANIVNASIIQKTRQQ